MKKKDTFYLSDVRFYDSGRTAVEEALFSFAREYRGMVMDRAGIVKLCGELLLKQEEVIRERPRLHRVEIQDPSAATEFGCHIKAGRVYVSFSRVTGYRVEGLVWEQ